MSVFALKLLMIVIMKALLSFYNIDSSIIREAQNAKELCIFENPAFVSFSLYNMPISWSPTSTMAAAGPAPGELVLDMVNQ